MNHAHSFVIAQPEMMIDHVPMTSVETMYPIVFILEFIPILGADLRDA